jgi:hypothetical protein
VQRILGIGDGLTLGGLAHQHLTVIGIGDDGRRGARALAVFYDLGLVALKYGDTGIGRSQINADDL